MQNSTESPTAIMKFTTKIALNSIFNSKLRRLIKYNTDQKEQEMAKTKEIKKKETAQENNKLTRQPNIKIDKM